MATGKNLTLTGAVLAAVVISGKIGFEAGDNINYAESVKYHAAVDKRIPAHVELVRRKEVVGEDTVEVVDSVQVAERVQRDNAIYRTPKDSTFAVGDTVRQVIMLKRAGGKWVVQGYADKPIDEPAAEGKVLKAYGRLVIWEDTEGTAEEVE